MYTNGYMCHEYVWGVMVFIMGSYHHTTLNGNRNLAHYRTHTQFQQAIHLEELMLAD